MGIHNCRDQRDFIQKSKRNNAINWIHIIIVCDLFISVPPSIDESKLDKNPKVVVNRTLVLNCPAAGIPTPDIKWLRNGEPVNVNRYSSLTLVAGGRQLRITKAQVSDTASYRCLVANKAGQAHVDFSLEVHGKLAIAHWGLW